jgi:hypothetical protein
MQDAPLKRRYISTRLHDIIFLRAVIILLLHKRKPEYYHFDDNDDHGRINESKAVRKDGNNCRKIEKGKKNEL